VTRDGLEMPRAQILQARACGLEPDVDMGPVLMKPVTPTGAQIILLGKALGAMEARDYFFDTSRFEAIAFQALDRLRARHPVLVLEGAGFLVTFWSAPTMTAGHLLFALGSTCTILAGTWFEERDLLRTLGPGYAQYRRTVPRFFPVPWRWK